MQHQLILVVKSGSTVPEELLKPAYEGYHKKISACAVLADVEGITTLSPNELDQTDYDTFKSFVNEELKDSPRILYMATSDQDIKDDNVPPFILLQNEKGHPVLVSVMEGDFTPHWKKENQETGLSNAYYFATEFLLPQVTEVASDFDGDLSKIIKKLNSPNYMQMLATQCAVRGTIAFLAANGDIIIVNKGDTHPSYDWGYCSDPKTVGFGVKTEAPTAVEDKRSALKAKLQAKKAEAAKATEPKPAVDDRSEIVQKLVAPPKTDAAVPSPIPTMVPTPTSLGLPSNTPVRMHEGQIQVKCPENLNSHQEVRDFYQNHAGFKPEGYKNKPWVTMRLKGFQSLDKAVEAKTTSAPPPDTGSAIERVPELDAKIRQAVLNDFFQGGRPIKDPKQIQASEERYPTFTDQLGISMDDICSMPWPTLRDFSCKYPVPMSIALKDIIMAYLAEKSKQVSTEKVTPKASVAS